MTDDDEQQRLVLKPSPLDVSGVRDPGMQSLIILAASLGWNVHQKQNQPVVITARDSMQKRLPTNTSIRMGVFQSALSTIMVHTDEDTVPTPELMDAIIAITKPSADHQRRLRLAVGETPAQHRERVAAHEAESKGSREPEPLTTRIELPEQQPTGEAQWLGPQQVAATEHGAIVSREPFVAQRSHSRTSASLYESDTSYERVFEDGFKDYECMVCGKVFATPKGVGSHSQIHTRVLEQKTPAWMRTGLTRVQRAEPEPEVEWEEPPGETSAPAEGLFPAEITVPRAASPFDPWETLAAINALVAPELLAERDELRAKNEILALEVERLGQNLQALKDLIGGL